MQSWGQRARWDIRDTGLEPTKSGVIGLIGSALGHSRDNPELERLDMALTFGVRVDRPGILSTDFHTVTGYHRTAEGGFKHQGGTANTIETAIKHKESTIVSQRDYLHDASFLVALARKPDSLSVNHILEDIAYCLRNPKWPLYLGRKSCVPSRPVYEDLTEEYPDIESAFRTEPLSSVPASITARKAGLPGEPLQVMAWIEDAQGDFDRQDAMRINQLRNYALRHCRRVTIETISLKRRD